jgi:hypothetical protein
VGRRTTAVSRSPPPPAPAGNDDPWTQVKDDARLIRTPQIVSFCSSFLSDVLPSSKLFHLPQLLPPVSAKKKYSFQKWPVLLVEPRHEPGHSCWRTKARWRSRAASAAGVRWHDVGPWPCCRRGGSLRSRLFDCTHGNGKVTLEISAAM